MTTFTMLKTGTSDEDHVYGRPGGAGTAGSLPLSCVRNQLIIVHYSRENGEVMADLEVMGLLEACLALFQKSADHCTLF